MPALTKLEVARRQLGTALWLFLEDLDPVSVHTLTGAGVELAEHAARHAGASPFIEHILQTNPGMSPQQYYALSRQFYNAFKHALQKNGAARDDSMLLHDFDDVQNDALLFVGWTDLIRASTSSPIEAQVFQAWFYACYPKKLAATEVANRFLSAFPPLLDLSRADRKLVLKAQIVAIRTNQVVMGDPRTEGGPLIYPTN